MIEKHLYIFLVFLLLCSCSKKAAVSNSTISYRKLQEYLIMSDKNPDDFLFVLNGTILYDSSLDILSKLKATDIAVVEKISQPAAKTIYGEQAKPQTIVINTKKSLY